jgi:hypothetical protein
MKNEVYSLTRVSAHEGIVETPSTQMANSTPVEGSQSDVILRRQRTRPKGGGGLKLTKVPSRFSNLSNDFEFAGWGSVSFLTLSENEHIQGQELLDSMKRDQILGQFTASAIAGNDILGGVFYTLPAVVAIAGILCVFLLLRRCAES